MATPTDPDRAQRAVPTPRWGDATRTIRAASRTPEVLQRPTAVPIFQTATFTTPDAESLAAVAADPRAGYSYSRLSNPTTTALGALYAELVDAEAGLALASGMAAIHAACASVLRAGDRVVAPIAAYGSTRVQLAGYFGRFGVDVQLVDMTDLDEVASALAAAPTRLLYAESSANPTTFVADHAALAELAHRHGALYFADNTFASPYVCQPLAYGADLVLESATKYLGGHNDITAGVVAGRRELVDPIGRVQVDTGATLAPLEAFLTIRGILTFPVRMDRHGQNALALAGWLERQEGVTRVLYPGLPSHPQHAVVERLWRPGNAGGMLAFEVAGGRAAGQAVIDTLQLSERTASLGGVHTMVVHPASTSQRQLNDEQLRASGIGPGMLRVSVGL
ncbi:MAG TPA: aminotransferase class I/II-fold pyridoxal phosphate-dependent enzyme, partial [Candidatus Sulfomarinibacteraceae bacterium]|nr:aminotransferase class I/II-fold pyridoxal phosphate-dependent enzyme [Candidatus Sulfomarinibacteraceae bacterium]